MLSAVRCGMLSLRIGRVQKRQAFHFKVALGRTGVEVIGADRALKDLGLFHCLQLDASVATARAYLGMYPRGWRGPRLGHEAESNSAPRVEQWVFGAEHAKVRIRRRG